MLMMIGERSELPSGGTCRQYDRHQGERPPFHLNLKAPAA